MNKFLHFLDEHLLGFMAGFLLLFIPLYPKIPIAEILPGYIVRLRLEDLIITVTLLLYGIQVLRGKATFWRTPLTKPIIIYAIIGALSILSGIFIVNRIPMESLHINKALLHYFRRLEYFSLFFVFFSTVKSIKQAKIYIGVYLIAILGVMVYGFGQKYLYWCAFSTMNREFSKGWCLYLTPHARVMSTFGGHYDLAAFTMVTLAILWSLIIGITSKLSKFLLAVLLGGSFWLIILTASRVSFIAYIVALTIVFFLWMFRKGIVWASSRWFGAFMLSMLLMLSFGDLSDRFLHLLKLDQRLGGFNQLLFKPIGEPPKNGQALDELAQVADKTDVPPSTTKPSDRPADVKEEIPDYRNVVNENGEIVAVQVKRVYSESAKKFDLSTGIRLDALWPKAWQGYLNNPLVGSGYSTLTKDKATDFTEAESTDNGYLRALGETGALGTWAFYAIIFTVLLRSLWAMQGIDDPVFFSFIIGGIAATVGLLINNLYIDTFEASKVAFPFWALSGVMLGGIESERERIAKKRTPLRLHLNFKTIMQKTSQIIRSDGFILLIIIVLAFVLRLHKFNTPLADWHSWRQADTSSVTRNFFKDGINVLYPTFDDLSSMASGLPNPKGYRMVEFPIYNVVSTFVKKFIPEIDFHQAGRLTSIFASLGTLIFLFLLTRKYLSRRAGILTAFFFAVLPYNIFYSRVVLPEPSLLFASTGMIYFFDLWIEKKIEMKRSKFKISKVDFIFILAVLFSSMALLIKPYAGFLFLPILYIAYRNLGFRKLFNPWLIGYGLLTVIPFVWWRWWINHFPEGIPAYTWLLNGNNIRFKGAFFFWIFADRIGRLILGYWGVALLFLGIIGKPKNKEGWVFYTWLIGILLYLCTFATGNVQHDYYQAITIPIICIFLAKGVDNLLIMSKESINKKISWIMIGVSIFFMLSFGWYHVRDLFNINHPELAEAGREVERLTKSNGRVIAPYQGDTAFLYQTNRKGWPIMEGSIDEMVAKGAHYYVSTNYDDLTKELIMEAEKINATKPYKILKKTPHYVIIQLVPDRRLPQ